jgi:hypothetical protein
MSAALECLCSPLCSYVCAGLSSFAIVVLIGLGSLFQQDYRFLGEEWKTEVGWHFSCSPNNTVQLMTASMVRVTNLTPGSANQNTFK